MLRISAVHSVPIYIYYVCVYYVYVCVYIYMYVFVCLWMASSSYDPWNANQSRTAGLYYFAGGMVIGQQEPWKISSSH